LCRSEIAIDAFDFTRTGNCSARMGRLAICSEYRRAERRMLDEVRGMLTTSSRY